MVASKTRKVAKLFFILTLFGLLIYMLAFYYLHKAYLFNSNDRRRETGARPSVYNQDLKYILMKTENPEALIEGQQLFIDYQCPHFVCYLTANKTLLKKNQEFDAVVVNVTDFTKMKYPIGKPKAQRWIFYGMEPSDQIPICKPYANNFFNYTWSYKLNSDIVSTFYTVRDSSNNIVAPSLYAEWKMSMPKSSLKREEVMKFKDKDKAVAMVVESCREAKGKIFANRLSEALHVHSEELHLFGCGRNKTGIAAMIAREYFFVLVTAGTAQDYITDSILNAYWNHAVPIVRARADLSKFLPTGSYINAHLQTPEQIAALVHYSIKNPSVYRSFFKWRNFYTFHKREEFDGICKLCSLLHDKSHYYSNSSAHLREWWESGRSSKIKCEQKLF